MPPLGTPDRYVDEVVDSGSPSIGTVDQGTPGATPWPVSDPTTTGTWGYYSGVSGTIPITGRVISITAVALQAAGSITINAGSVIPLPYGATDKVSTSLTIEPRGQLVDPTIVFTNTDSYFVEVLT